LGSVGGSACETRIDRADAGPERTADLGLSP
jgi:hypothetical protein